MELRNKKILLMGLGILGGGVATAKWLVERGAVLTVTDLKDSEHLKPSLEKLEDFKDKIKLVLGEHKESDFLENDIVVINPDVPADNKFVKLARDAGKQIENELTLFYKFCPSRKIIAVTGTRGKTTTVNWTAHLLKSKNKDTLALGNSPDRPLLGEIDKCNESTDIVIETPSFLLEICDKSEFAPHIAVITNLYRDHINRHRSMKEYAKAKSNIFKYQKENNFLILNKEDKWTDFFLDQKPKAKILFFSENESIVNKNEFIKQWGKHNLHNLSASIAAAAASGVTTEEIKKQIGSLPQMKFRQEKIFENANLTIYNDTAATSPEALIVSTERFLSDGGNVIFISGGTDRDLDFKDWAVAVGKILKPDNFILLSGSATEKMKRELGWGSFNEFDNLEECFNKALQIAKTKSKAKIIFSPGAKSFEKFKNEFDRGEQFNSLVKEMFI